VDRSPRLSWTLLGGYALSNLFGFLSVWITALLMFVNRDDFTLVTITLLFAGGIALSLRPSDSKRRWTSYGVNWSPGWVTTCGRP
jgi:hypothetical protein